MEKTSYFSHYTWQRPYRCRAAVALGAGPCPGAGAGPAALCPPAEPASGHPRVLLRHLSAGADGQPAGAPVSVASAPERALHGMRGLRAGLPLRGPASGRPRHGLRAGLALHPVPGLPVRLPSRGPGDPVLRTGRGGGGTGAALFAECPAHALPLHGACLTQLLGAPGKSRVSP